MRAAAPRLPSAGSATRAKPTLEAALKDSDPTVAVNAKAALGMLQAGGNKGDKSKKKLDATAPESRPASPETRQPDGNKGEKTGEKKPDAAAPEASNDKLLDEPQRLYRDWTETTFADLFNASLLQQIGSAVKAEKEENWLDELATLEGRERIPAINGLAALRTKKAVPDLLKVATDREEKDNRDRWMAVRLWD